MNVGEFLMWLEDLSESREGIERVGAMAGANKVVSGAPGAGGRRPRAIPLGHNRFRASGRFNAVDVQTAITDSVSSEIDKQLK